MRIVLDTNVLIDGDQDDLSYANKIIEEVLAGKLEAFANRGTIRENQLIAGQKLIPGEYADKVQAYLTQVKLVDPAYIDVEIEDREDRKILASAVIAEADYLISSDKHLLHVGEFENVKIVKPGDFWLVYKEEVLGESPWDQFKRQFLGGE